MDRVSMLQLPGRYTEHTLFLVNPFVFCYYFRTLLRHLTAAVDSLLTNVINAFQTGGNTAASEISSGRT